MIRTIHEYLSTVPAEALPALESLRARIRGLVPEAEEVISYQIPTFKLRKKALVAYGATKDHCALYLLSPALMERFSQRTKGYLRGKVALHFTPAEPLPQELVDDLVKARIAELQ
jgi:uncharacterized protein YdhG (YjbR/CyaY superfamily)